MEKILGILEILGDSRPLIEGFFAILCDSLKETGRRLDIFGHVKRCRDFSQFSGPFSGQFRGHFGAISGHFRGIFGAFSAVGLIVTWHGTMLGDGGDSKRLVKDAG